MDRPGGVPGGVIAELRNLHSQRLYVVSTAPELGQDYWTTTVMPMVTKKTLLGFRSQLVPDVYHPVVSIIRNRKEDAYPVHAEVRHIVGTLPEGDWFEAWPSPRPPDGYSPGARARLKALGVDDE